jgi:methylated-DNA-[protein]-cysteine S-methyltransferase
MIYQLSMSSPAGTLILSEEDEKIIEISFGKSDICGIIKETNVLVQCRSELNEYFASQRTEFSVPISMKGTAFRKKVWNALINIPYGKTASYKDIAEAVGCPKGARAVGSANHNNPIPIIVPCHRVITADRKLGGYAGGLEIKRLLLETERTKKG